MTLNDSLRKFLFLIEREYAYWKENMIISIEMMHYVMCTSLKQCSFYSHTSY